MTTQALAERPKIPTQIITDPRALGDLIVEWSTFYNIVGPLFVNSFAEMYGASVSLVKVDSRINDQGQGPECYYDKQIHQRDERSLGKTALDKLSMAAGVSWSRMSFGGDDGNGPHYYAYTAYGAYTSYDGAVQQISGHVALDLRDAATAGWSQKRLAIARSFISRNAESNAKNRAVRQALALHQKYTLVELDRAFLVLRPTFVPDMSNPAVAAAVTTLKLGGVDALYPPPALPPGDPHAIDVQTEPSSGEADPPARSAVDAVPEGAIEFSPDPLPSTGVPPPDIGIFTIASVLQQDDVFLIGVKELPSGHFFVTDDMAVARDAHVAKGRTVQIAYDEGAAPRRPIVNLVAKLVPANPDDRY